MISLVVAAVLLMGTAPTAANDVVNWNGLASLGFTQCYARADILGAPPCLEHELVLDGECSVECFPQIPNPHVFVGARSQIGWTLQGISDLFYYPARDFAPGTLGHVEGVRVSPEILELSGKVFTQPTSWPSAEVEFAVFRFDGDPAVFDGVEIRSVYSLVWSGAIDSGDVLFTRVYDGNHGWFEEQVAGVLDDEIVILGTSSRSVAVPAVTTGGAVVLTLTLLLLATYFLRRRHRTS